MRGRDFPHASLGTKSKYFNPRAPCGGATLMLSGVSMDCQFQSTRPVRGRDHQDVCLLQSHNCISIHAPRAGARRRASCVSLSAGIFQSTRPVRGRDLGLTADYKRLLTISIHAPRAGARHPTSRSMPDRWLYFNPRAPCGGATLSSDAVTCTATYFNPRAPCGGATRPHSEANQEGKISCPAPAGGARRHRITH